MKIDKTEVYGFEHALRGMRNPLASHDKSDSYACVPSIFTPEINYIIGENDLKLAQKLILAGEEHSKFMRQISVWVDLTLPLYVWKEFDQYKIGVTTDSFSTMHKITSRELNVNDFEYDYWNIFRNGLLAYLNNHIRQYKIANSKEDKENLFRQIVQDLPSGYLQKRTVSLNYAVLRNLYFQRRNHKLSEWHEICNWILQLPYGKELICIEKE